MLWTADGKGTVYHNLHFENPGMHGAQFTPKNSALFGTTGLEDCKILPMQ